MATNQTSFTELPQFKKGLLGEQIVIDIFKNDGWIIYTPEKGKAHCFDILAIKDKKMALAIDVKTKARLNKWNAQGINLTHYNEYLYFKNRHNMPFYLFFIDDKNGEIHYQEIGKLKNEFYICENKIICWPIDCMILCGKISDEQINQLSELDTRNYTYLPA